MAFEFVKLNIPDVILVKPKVYEDERGFFIESYKQTEFNQNGIAELFIQDNHSKSSKGVLRGLHYQLNPFAQGKLVRCIRGSLFDVAVDIRKDSPTFGKWVGTILSEENKHLLYIPPGFAHGFYTLSDYTEILYKTTAEYNHNSERGILWNDSAIGIDWPIDGEPVLSEKDKNQILLVKAEVL